MTQQAAVDAAAVDTGFLDHALGGAHGRVVAATTERIGTGQVAVTLLAHLHWSVDDPSLPRTVVVKVAADQADREERRRRSVAYRREVCFYHHLASRVDASTPTCRYAAYDPADGTFTLVLDEAEGRVGDQLRGCSPAQAEVAIDAAARLHASTWNDPSLEGLDWLYPHGPDAAQRRAERYRLLLPGFTARYAARLSPSVVGVAHWLAARLPDVEQATRLPRCLTHQDLRIDNLLFAGTSADPRVTVLDWQTVGLGSGPTDVAYFIGSGLLPDERAAHEWQLVDRYADGLARRGAEVDTDDLRHDYRLGSASGMVMAVIASQVVGRTERGDELFAVLAERHARQMLDLRLDELVN